jgi:DNA modification methylase
VSAAEPYFDDGQGVRLFLGDCLDVLRTLESDSIDSIVTDPPAGIAFMGREWDDFHRARDRFVDMLTERMAEARRVLKPGSHALVWSIPRTSHWTAWALEDAGFDIRDCIPHLFGSGFAKGRDLYRLDVLPAVEQQLRDQGVEGEIVWR